MVKLLNGERDDQISVLPKVFCFQKCDLYFCSLISSFVHIKVWLTRIWDPPVCVSLPCLLWPVWEHFCIPKMGSRELSRPMFFLHIKLLGGPPLRFVSTLTTKSAAPQITMQKYFHVFSTYIVCLMQLLTDNLPNGFYSDLGNTLWPHKDMVKSVLGVTAVSTTK